jgi:hypothetical protein
VEHINHLSSSSSSSRKQALVGEEEEEIMEKFQLMLLLPPKDHHHHHHHSFCSWICTTFKPHANALSKPITNYATRILRRDRQGEKR